MRFRQIITTGILTVLIPLQAAAVEWGNAPLGCFPSRAERWHTQSQMEPCHCPPQDFCPKPITLGANDIKLTVVLNGFAYSFTAGDIGLNADEAKSLFTRSEDEIAALINDKAKSRVGGADLLNKHGSWFTREITISLSNNIPGLDAWKNDTLDMPVGLATRCCDSVCPTGTFPTTTQTTIYAYDGVQTEGMKAAVSGAQAAYDQAIKEQQDWTKLLQNYLLGGGKMGPIQVVYTVQFQKAVDTAKANLDAAQGTLKGQATHAYTLNVMSCQSAEKHFVSYREGCILEGTQIVREDGTTTPIEQLRIGDVLKGKKGLTRVKAINRFTQQQDTLYGINGGTAFISPEHPILTVSGWKSINPEITSVRSDLGTVGLLVVGDEIVTAKGTVKVESIDKHTRKGSTVLNLALDGDGTFIANDVVVHGFDHVQIHY